MTDALDAVIDAALERAVLDAADARRYFALAGALKRGRSATQTDDAGCSPDEDRRPDPTQPHPPDGSTGPLGAALLSTVAVEALDTASRDDIDPGAWSPGAPAGGPRTDLVAAGAAAACRRLDMDPETVAARARVPPERLSRYRTDGGAATESR